MRTTTANRGRAMRKVTVTVSLCVFGTVRAAGVDSPDQGVQAMGRGGAFVAKADDPTAIYYNPAGLAKLRGSRALFHSSFLAESLSFERAPTDTEEFPKVSNSDNPFWLPFIAVTSNLGFERATFAIGIFGPNANQYRTWPTCVDGATQEGNAYCGDETKNAAKYAPQRYLAMKQDLFVAFPTVGGAYRVLPWLDLGATFAATYASVHVEQVANAVGASQPSSDTRALLGGRDGKLVDPITPLFQLGVLARPPLALPSGHGLELGLTWRSPLTLDLEGDVDVDLSDTLTGAGSTLTPEQPSGTLVMPLPWILRGGVRYVVVREGVELWDIELDATYEPYASVDSIDVNFSPPLEIQIGGQTNTIDTFEQPHQWENTGSVRLGGGYNFAHVGPGSLHLRAGGNFEGAAAPEPYTQLDFFAHRRLGVAGGIGYEWRGITFAVAYQHGWMETRNVSDSEIRTTNVLTPDVCDPDLLKPGEKNPCDVIGNGTYRSSMQTFAVGVDVAFDELLGR